MDTATPTCFSQAIEEIEAEPSDVLVVASEGTAFLACGDFDFLLRCRRIDAAETRVHAAVLAGVPYHPELANHARKESYVRPRTCSAALSPDRAIIIRNHNGLWRHGRDVRRSSFEFRASPTRIPYLDAAVEDAGDPRLEAATLEPFQRIQLAHGLDIGIVRRSPRGRWAERARFPETARR